MKESEARKTAEAARERQGEEALTERRLQTASESREEAAVASCRSEAAGLFSGSSVRWRWLEGMVFLESAGQQRPVVSERIVAVFLSRKDKKSLGLLKGVGSAEWQAKDAWLALTTSGNSSSRLPQLRHTPRKQTG